MILVTSGTSTGNRQFLIKSLAPISVFISLLMLLNASAFGAPVSLETAHRAAEMQLEHHLALYGSWCSDSTPHVRGAQKILWHGNELAYQFDIHPAGYVIVAVDDVFSPVLLYSTAAAFDPRRVNDHKTVESWIVPELDHRLKVWQSRQKPAGAGMAIKAESGSAARIRNAWRRIYGTAKREQNQAADQVHRHWANADKDSIRNEPADKGSIRIGNADQDHIPFWNGAGTWSPAGRDVFFEPSERSAASRVGPVLTTRWGQDAPYNAWVPDDDCGSGHALAGCVAVAWAQLLHYWRWPDKARGSIAYTWSGRLLEVDFDAEPPYEWEQMPDRLDSGSSYSQVDAVARLIYHLALAAETVFACDVSSSARFADEILDTYFKFHSDMQYHDRGLDGYSNDQWFALIKSELEADPPRPVILSIWDTQGRMGHEVIADGYQSGDTDLIHLNFGWEGNLDLFYCITDSFETGGTVWSANTQVIITGIQPAAGRSSPDHDSSGGCFIQALFQ